MGGESQPDPPPHVHPPLNCYPVLEVFGTFSGFFWSGIEFVESVTPGTGIRFAFQTHYDGDIRAGSTGLLDTYLLKSLDTFAFDALDKGPLPSQPLS